LDLGRLIKRRSAGDERDARARRLGFGGRRRRGWLTGAALLSGFLAVPLVWGNGVLPVDVPLLDNVAWLPSDAHDEVARVNGETGEVDHTLSVGAAGDGGGDITVEQADGVVLVEVGGVVSRIDVAQLDWGDRSAAADGEVVVGDGAAYLVQPGTGVVQGLNPETLSRSAAVDLGVSLQGAGIVVAGYLVVPGSDGELHVVSAGREVGSTPAGVAGERVLVSQVGEEVVALNVDAGRLSRFALSTGQLQSRGEVDVDVFTGEVVVPAHLPAGRLWVLAPGSGELVGVDLPSGDVVTVPVVAPGGDRRAVSGPVVARGRVYVVDRVEGRLVEVDAETAEVIDDGELGVDDASQVDVVVQGDTVFVNDRAGSTAVVIDGDDRHQVDKYDDQGPGSSEREGAPPGGEQPGPSGGATTATTPPDNQGTPPDRGDDRPTTTVVTTPTVPSTTGPTSTTTAPTTTTTTAPPVVAPGAVTGLTAVAGDGGVQLSWQPPATGTPPITYTVSWTPGGGSVTAAGPTYDATGLTNDVTYRFTVTARNAAGAGPAAQADATPRSPVTPPEITYILAREPNGVGSGNPWQAGIDYQVGSGVDVTCYAEKTGQPGTRISGSCPGPSGTTYFGPFNLAAGECTSWTVVVETNVGSDSGTTETECGAGGGAGVVNTSGTTGTTGTTTTTQPQPTPCVINGTPTTCIIAPMSAEG
jgi:fibronectin type III domain protein